MTENEWPRFVVETFWEERGWEIVDDSISDTEVGAETEYKRVVGYYPVWLKKDEEPREGRCRMRQCRIEVKP